MSDFEKELAGLREKTVLCVGDPMLDEFVYGEVTRISPEAPAPVLAVQRSETNIGGAGNVARNLASLGVRCVFVGVIGDDQAGRELSAAFADFGLIEPHLVIAPARPTTRKMRFVSEHFSTHLMRADWEKTEPVAAAQEQAVIEQALAALPGADAVVLSDYAKGTLTQRVVRALLDAALAAKKPVVVDPKGKDFARYRGATLITPNRQELAAATRSAAESDDEIVAAAEEVEKLVGCKAVLVTRSEQGMTLVVNGAEPVHVAAYPVKVRDVSGAGDTVAAVLGAMLAAEAGFEAAMRAANAAAAVAVSKRGTATVSLAELRGRLLPAASLASEEKILYDWSQLDERLAAWRSQGLRIGFTNGCFDLLHPGHVKLLTEARGRCDRLIVGLNSDASVRRLKGEARPVQDVHARAEVLAALEAVDLVVIFEEDTPLKLMARVRPKLLIKGGDYRLDQVVGREQVEADGGQVMLVDIVPGFSTTKLVNRSRTAAGA
ncbi:MAG TPA: D-glycero-beta-D-manno-heptose-7-phosphate kinase [Xanthobacteraceae bacterium]|nr:D-glycero-beta-D-manno-heptose-7-phosphate kinase [Xanthobacteraceae bacterium]